MSLFKSKNPALKADIFTKLEQSTEVSDVMTLQGTVNKTGVLGLIVFLCAMVTWSIFQTNPNHEYLLPIMLGGSILAFVLAIIVIVKKTTAPILAPAYCALQGFVLGGISAFMNDIFPGIVIQALILTFGILFSLILIYRMGLIRATENFKLIIASATSGVAIYYLASIAGVFIGYELPFIHESSTSGIIFSVVVVVIAALNLVVDFDFIEQGAAAKAPKYMEWYGAFGLMVTLIWLYLELLRLMAKLRR